MILRIILLLSLQSSFGVIVDLNEWKYDRMPPLFELDEYPKCVRSNGTYCYVKLEIQTDSSNEVSTIIQEYSNYRAKHFNHSIIDRGVCVERSCNKFIKNEIIETKTKEALEEVLGECLNDTIFKEYGVETKLTEVLYCNKQDDQQQTYKYYGIIKALFLGILVINIIGSLYDVYFQKYIGQKNNRMGNPYMLGFSIRRNWQSLVAPIKESSTMYPLRTLHGARVLCMSLAILAHTLVMICSFIDNPRDVEKFYDALPFQILVTGSSVVQIFFMMSAFLQGYKLLEDEEQGVDTTKELPKTLMLRWWRLTPAYAVCLAFLSTWLDRLDSGPLWSNLSVTVVKDCRRYWWLHLLYLNSFVTNDDYCMVQTWQLATDMQLHIMGLVTMVVLRRWRVQVLLMLLAVGLIVPAVTVWTHDLDARLIFGPETYRNLRDSSDTFKLVYRPPHTNILIFAVGLLASMLCRHFQRTGLQINQYKFYTPFFALMIPGIIAMFLTGVRYYSPAPAPLLERAVYTPLVHAVLGVIMTIAVVGMVLGYDAGLCSYFAWHGWVVLARLSYGLYLVHLPLLHLLHASRTGLDHSNFINTVIYFIGVYVVSTVLALVLYLLVENPFYNVAKTYLNRDKREHVKLGDEQRVEQKHGEKLTSYMRHSNEERDEKKIK